MVEVLNVSRTLKVAGWKMETSKHRLLRTGRQKRIQERRLSVTNGELSTTIDDLSSNFWFCY